MGAWGTSHWLLLLAIAILLFGGRRIAALGSDFGNMIAGFRKALRGGNRVEQEKAGADDRTSR